MSGCAERDLYSVLKEEKEHNRKGGIYHKIQIELTYNSNHIEGGNLSEEETRYIYETNTIGTINKPLNVDDIVETANHFRCIDIVIDKAKAVLSGNFIKLLHLTLKNGTSDSRRSWSAVGEYKKIPNEVANKVTVPPEKVKSEMQKLLAEYNAKSEVMLDDILDFHYRFECIHPFSDGNGRVGRLIMFKECLKNKIVPFIISDDIKVFYYRGLFYWRNEKGYLRDTCLTAQDRFKRYLDYFRISYQERKIYVYKRKNSRYGFRRTVQSADCKASS